MAIEFTPLRSEFSLIPPGDYVGVIVEAGARILPATGETYYEFIWSMDVGGQPRTFKDWLHPDSTLSARQEVSRRKLTALCDALKFPLREGEKNTLDSGLFIGKRACLSLDVVKLKDGKDRNIVKAYAAL